MSDNAQTTAIRYAIMPSPIGQLLIAATDSGVVQLAFENQEFDRVVKRLEDQFGAVERDDEALHDVIRQLEEYFGGTRKSFDLSIQQATPDGFMTTVQQTLETIPYGQTLSYGQLAQQLDKPGAARAVGTACAKNPIPLIQPCHRVVRSDGSFGEYSGTPEAKQYLLAFERGENPHAPAS